MQQYAPSGPGWQAPQTLSQPTFRAFEAHLASDGSGRTTLISSSYDPGNPLSNSKLLAADRPAGGAWQALPPIVTGSVPQSIQVAANSSGASVVVWVQGFSVWAAYRSAGGGWSAPTQLGNGSNGVYSPSAAIDQDGMAVVAWMRSTSPPVAFVETRFRKLDGTWAATETQPSGPGGADYRPHVAFDGDGEAVLSWQSNETGYSDILTSSHPRGGAWSVPVHLSAPGANVDDPSLAGNGNGTVVATWIDTTRVMAAVRSAGSWGAPTALAFMQSSLAEEPRAAIDRAGDATVVWNRFDGNIWRTEASSRPAGGAWQAVADTLGADTPGQSKVDVATDPAGDAVAAWRRSDGANLRIEAARKPAGGSWQPVPDLVSPRGVDADSPTVTIDPSGLAVVAWTIPGAGGNEVAQAAVSSRAAPGAYVRAPADGASFAYGSSVKADYSCSDEPDGAGIASCAGTVANGALIDTSTTGSHSFTVTATDNAGSATSVTHHYTVGQPAGIHISGTHIVDAAGVPLILRGVDYSGTEYMCVQGSPTPSTHGRGIFEGPANTPTPPAAMSSWAINAVRLPLNEDCWLGINGVDPSYGGASYRTAVTSYVNALVAQGIVPILELSGSAPGNLLAGDVGQQPMPDRDHSIDFWLDVASAFKDDGSVVFDLYNEPFPDGNQDTVGAWTCWRDGGNVCSPAVAYDAVGMQELVDTVRTAGATNLILLGGVQFARIDSDWLTYRPSDPADNLAASWHLYPNTYCPTESCWDAQYQPFLSQTAAVATEIGQGGTAPCGADFLDRAMVWLDAHSQGYLAWTWDAWGDCLSLIADWGVGASPYAPTSPYGRTYHDHLLGVPQPPTAVVGAAGDGRAAVSWAPPADRGTAAITSYLVTPHDRTVGSDRPAMTATGTSATIAGLTNGHAYTFTVTATSASGTGAPSAASTAVTPQAGYPTPAAVTGIASPTGATTVETSADPAATGGTATSVTVPSGTAGGTVSVVHTGTSVAAPSGYQFGNLQVDVSAPAATATNPLTLVFTMTPPSGLPPPPDPVTLSSTEIFRAEGAGTPTLVPDCTGPSGQAQADGSPCVSSRQYVTISGQTYIRVTVLSATASHWLAARPKAAAVSVSARGYSPQRITVPPGAYVNWSFVDGKSHSVTDSLGLGSAGSAWFDSGLKTSGAFRFAFSAAGTFSYTSTKRGESITGEVLVPVAVTPASGHASTSFSVIWSTRAVSGYAFDVRYRFKPAGSTKWTNWTAWKTGVATTSAAFTPNRGSGTYDFTALLRNRSTGRASAYSPDSSITVS